MGLKFDGEISKQACQEQANDLWKRIKDNHEEIRRYLELPELQLKSGLAHKFTSFVRLENQLTSKDKEDNPDILSHTSSSKREENITTNASLNKTPDAAESFKDRNKYLREHKLSMLKYFIKNILPNEDVSKILSEDTLATKEYTEPFVGAVYEWQKFMVIREKYKNSTLVTKKTSALQQSLKEIEEQEAKVGTLLKEASDVDVDKSKGAHVLALSYVKKSQLLTQAVVEITKLKSLVTDRTLKNSLQRRLSQIGHRKDIVIQRQKGELIEAECLNGTDLSWQEALDNIIEQENAAVKNAGPLNYTSLREVWGIMSESLLLTLEEIYQFLALDSEIVSLSELKCQLLKVLPVLAVSHAGKCPCIINLHEMVLTPGAFDTILKLDKDDPSLSPPPSFKTSEDQLNSQDKQLPQELRPSDKRGGRPSIVDKFPGIVTCATEFIKQHGFRAHQRRRTSTGTSLGVTIGEIKKHLYDNIVGLREHGIGDSTIRYASIA